jgi:hypothetical protein
MPVETNLTITEPKMKRGPGRPPLIDAHAVLAALESGESAREIADRLQVHITAIYRSADRARLQLFRRAALTMPV